MWNKLVCVCWDGRFKWFQHFRFRKFEIIPFRHMSISKHSIISFCTRFPTHNENITSAVNLLVYFSTSNGSGCVAETYIGIASLCMCHKKAANIPPPSAPFSRSQSIMKIRRYNQRTHPYITDSRDSPT